MEETENEVIGAELSDGSRRKFVTLVVITSYELALLQPITSLSITLANPLSVKQDSIIDVQYL